MELAEKKTKAEAKVQQMKEKAYEFEKKVEAVGVCEVALQQKAKQRILMEQQLQQLLKEEEELRTAYQKQNEDVENSEAMTSQEIAVTEKKFLALLAKDEAAIREKMKEMTLKTSVRFTSPKALQKYGLVFPW